MQNPETVKRRTELIVILYEVQEGNLSLAKAGEKIEALYEAEAPRITT